MDEKQIAKYRKRLNSQIPIVGELLKRSAARKLAESTDPAANDTLCEIAIREPNGSAARICIESGKRPSESERACLFLFVTRQFEEFYQENYGFHYLRMQYPKNDPPVQKHILDIVRSDKRLGLGFFGKRKPISECTDWEIQLAITAALRSKNWPLLFRAFLDLPLKYGYPLLESFRQSGWNPDEAQFNQLYKQVLSFSQNQNAPSNKESNPSCSLFEQWLAKGESAPYTNLSESDLLKRLQSCEPLEGVSLVAALAKRSPSGSRAAQPVQQHSHWLVRLAGYATGLCFDIPLNDMKNDNYWIQKLVDPTGILELWPCKTTRVHLDELRNSPREAWQKKFGAMRNVLQALIDYHIATGVYDEIDFGAGEFSWKIGKTEER